MRKIYFFLVAALCSMATIVQAQTWDFYEFLDTRPDEPTIMHDITFDKETSVLKFYDTFDPTRKCPRKYELYFYSFTKGHLAKLDLGALSHNYLYAWGTEEDGHFVHAWISNTVSREINNSEGGWVEFDLTEKIEELRGMGYNSLRINIQGYYYEPGFQWREMEQSEVKHAGINNEITVEYPIFYDNYPNCTTRPVQYGKKINVRSYFKVSERVFCYLQQEAPDGTWNTIQAQSFTRDKAFESAAVQAKMEYTREYLTEGHSSPLRFRTVLFCPTRNESDTSDVDEVKLQYFCSVNNVTTYHEPGETVTIDAPSAHKRYRILSAAPIEFAVSGDNYSFTMPTNNVTLYEEDQTYTVRFLDYDYSLIDEQVVLEGADAVAPETPSHSGMTFEGWDGAFTNIQQNTVVRAMYTVDGVSVKLTNENNITSANQGENITFQAAVKSNVSQSAKVYLQSAFIENEGDALSWKDGNSSKNITADNVVAGSTVEFSEVTVLPTGTNYNGYRARYFRLRVVMGGVDYYSNVYRVDVFYPVEIYSPDYEVYTMTDCSTLTGNDTIYSRPGDTVWVRETTASVCDLDLELYTGWDGVAKGVEDERGSYVVMPAGYGQNMITVSRQKFDVVFFVEGQSDGYWSLIYGEGANKVYEKVECGSAVSAPEILAPEGYSFLGWKARGSYADDAYTSVSDSLRFDAVFQKNETFTITFVDYDGTELKTQEVEIGENATPPAVPYHDGMMFIGWDGKYQAVTADATVTALYDSYPEGIEEPTSDSSLKGRAKKVLRDGVLLIERNGHIYNAQGAVVD